MRHADPIQRKDDSMIGRLFTALSVVLLLLFAAMIGLRVRSYRHLTTALVRIDKGQAAGVNVVDGRLAVGIGNITVTQFNRAMLDAWSGTIKWSDSDYDGAGVFTGDVDPCHDLYCDTERSVAYELKWAACGVKRYDASLLSYDESQQLYGPFAEMSLSGRSIDGRFIAIPLSTLAFAALILPALWAVRCLCRLRRRAGGLCANCGYDLRASTGRCPECGTTIPQREGVRCGARSNA